MPGVSTRVAFLKQYSAGGPLHTAGGAEGQGDGTSSSKHQSSASARVGSPFDRRANGDPILQIADALSASVVKQRASMLASGRDRELPSVPRSKGCLTCVSRRTRCDGARPICHACEKRGLVCGGYRRTDVVFLNEGWRTLGVAAVRKSKSRKKAEASTAVPQTSTMPPPTFQNSCDEVELDRATPSHVRDGVVVDEQRLSLVAQPSLPRSQLHATFLLSSFGNRPFQSLDTMTNLFRHYLSLDLSNRKEASKSCTSPIEPATLAVNALACAHFGMAHTDAVSVRQSFRSYGMALQAMSSCLQQMEAANFGPHNISEEEWQHFAFFCLVMAFCETKMSPGSRTWETHVRSLAIAITLRGENHAYSETNYQLLASSRLLLMLHTLSARKSNDWQYSLPVRSAWLTGIKTALRQAENPHFDEEFQLYQSLDLLMVDVTTVTSIMFEFDRLVAPRLPNQQDVQDLPQRQCVQLIDLCTRATDSLTRNEERLLNWADRVSEVPVASWLTSSGLTGIDFLDKDMRQIFQTILNFPTMLVYNAITTYWTITMSLRLLLSDMLAAMIKTGSDSVPADSETHLRDHRKQLMDYAMNVLRTICYATHTDSKAVAPFAVTAAFQLTVKVLDREMALLTAEMTECAHQVQSCKTMRNLATQYLEWAVRNKIPVKME